MVVGEVVTVVDWVLLGVEDGVVVAVEVGEVVTDVVWELVGVEMWQLSNVPSPCESIALFSTLAVASHPSP